MNRRGFLRMASVAAASGLVVQADYFIHIARNPVSLVVPETEIIAPKGNHILTATQITRDALRILGYKTSIMNEIGQKKIVPPFDSVTVRYRRVPLDGLDSMWSNPINVRSTL